MTGRTTTTTSAGSRFALTFGWHSQDGKQTASIDLDIRDAARLHDALSQWFAEIDEDELFEACMAWHRDTLAARVNDGDELDGDAG